MDSWEHHILNVTNSVIFHVVLGTPLTFVGTFSRFSSKRCIALVKVIDATDRTINFVQD